MSQTDNIDDSAAPLIEHLAELRNRLIWAVAAYIVAILAAFVVADPILQFLLRPIEEAMRALGDPNPVMQYTACRRRVSSRRHQDRDWWRALPSPFR